MGVRRTCYGSVKSARAARKDWGVRIMRRLRISSGFPVLLALAVGTHGLAQKPDDPFPTPIPVEAGAVRVNLIEFASLPDVGGEAARMMLLVDEPGTRRLFVNDMRGPLYTVSYDGKAVTLYLDVNAATWGAPVQSMGRERGVQSFALHPQFAQRGAPGFGKLYTWMDTSNMMPVPDFLPAAGSTTPPTHDTVLLEWTTKTPTAAAYDGGPPRELMRLRQPFANHNAGQLAFNPEAVPGTPDFGLLFVGVADGGSGGDPLRMAQNMGSIFGKIVRIDPLGTNSANKKYGIPRDNPFVGTAGTLPEIYAFGVRNPQRFSWDPRGGRLFLADIGQNIVEEISVITRAANLGWNDWEGSFKYISRTEVGLTGQRADPKVTYPIVEYGQLDPLLQPQSAVTGVVVYRTNRIPQLANLLLFGDNPSGEVFYVSADKLPTGGQDAVRRVVFGTAGAPRTLLSVIQEKNMAQGKKPATRADLRFGTGPDGRVFLLNKADGTIRELAR
jgi:hypothetical protein